MKTWLGAGGALLAAAGIAAYLYFPATTAPAAKLPPAAVPVNVATAAQGDFTLRVQVVGRTEALESTTVRSRVDGQVRSVTYTDGQLVAAGTPLLQLDAADFAARLRQAEANLARDQALAARARQDLERYQSLHDRGFVSAEKVAEMRAAADAQGAAARADQAAVDLARLQLSYCEVRAPIAGQIGARLVAAGTAVKVNDTALAVINRVQPIYATFSVPEKYLARLRAALARGPIKVALTIPAGDGRRHPGEARFLDNAVDAGSGTILMKALLGNDDRSLTPGQFVNVAIDLDVLPAAVTIPAEAVQQGPEGQSVFVVADDSAQMRRVDIAAIQDGVAVVGAGVKAGEVVVTDGQLRLTAGARVRAAGKTK